MKNGRWRRRPSWLCLPILAALHQLRMERPLDPLFFRCTIEFGMYVVAMQLLLLLLFHHQRMRLGPRILAHARDLPGNFDVRYTRADRELVVLNFVSHNRLRELPDHRELIAAVSVEGFEPVRKIDGRLALGVGRDVAGVD